MFQGDKHDTLPQTVYDCRWHRQLMGWLASLTMEDEVRQDLGLPQVVSLQEKRSSMTVFHRQGMIYMLR